MKNIKDKENELIKKINLILNDYENYEKVKTDSVGNIIIKNKAIINRKGNSEVLSDIFKQMIANDIKKNRV